MTDKEQLIQDITNKAYKELLGQGYWECGEHKETDTRFLVYRLEDSVENVFVCAERKFEYEKKSNDESLSEDNREIYKRAVALLDSLVNDIVNARTIEDQKALYERDKSVYNSHNYIEFPMSHISGWGKEQSAVILYYTNLDTIGNNKNWALHLLSNYDSFKRLDNNTRNKIFSYIAGKMGIDIDFDGYVALEHSERTNLADRDMLKVLYHKRKDVEEFIKANIEFTHMSICHTNNTIGGMISLFGNVDPEQHENGAVIDYMQYRRFPHLFDAWSANNFYTTEFNKALVNCRNKETIVVFDTADRLNSYVEHGGRTEGMQLLVDDYTREIELRAINEDKYLIVLGSYCAFDQNIRGKEVKVDTEEATKYDIYIGQKNRRSIHSLLGQADLEDVKNTDDLIVKVVDNAYEECVTKRENRIRDGYIKKKQEQLKKEYNKCQQMLVEA